MRSAIIKKIKKDLKITATFIASLAIAVVGTVSYKNIQYADYAPTKQVEAVAQALDCDLRYTAKVGGMYCRPKHNGDEPVYVYIDDAYTSVQRDKAIQALDYVFGIIGQINDKYRYQVVDKATYDKVGSKSKISFFTEQHEGAVAVIFPNIDIMSLVTSKIVENEGKIYLNPTQKSYSLYSAFVHELGHWCGLADVYTKNVNSNAWDIQRYAGNTYMNSTCKFSEFTPNDVKCFYSLLAEKGVDLSKAKAWVADYEKQYYYNETQRMFGKDEQNRTNETVGDDFICEGELSTAELLIQDLMRKYGYNGVTNSQILELRKNADILRYRVIVDGPNYSLQILDESDNVLDSASGEVLYVNGSAVLKDVELSHTLYPGVKESGDADYYKKGWIKDLYVLPLCSNNSSITKVLFCSPGVALELHDLDLEKLYSNDSGLEY
ncbi:MAG: hypothetical protein E7351_00780 [Clostridiales bacterium]|nr:hypothetical protein [Clostridiales bacterium]